MKQQSMPQDKNAGTHTEVRSNQPGDDKQKEKVADKPHTVTILLGVLSPSLALMALFFSLYSCRQSERALEIAQRAYLSVKSGRVRLARMEVGAPRASGENVPMKPILTMALSINLDNAGNTPAQFVSFTPTYDQLPSGWTVEKREWVPKIKIPGDLGPKSQEVWLYRETFELTPQAWEQVSNRGVMSIINLSGKLIYKDIFNQEHALNWCWSMPAYDRYDDAVSECIILEKTK